MLVLRAMFTVVGLAGLTLLAFAARFTWTTVRFLTRGVRAEGTVVSSFRRRLVRGHQQWVRVRLRAGDVERQAEGEVHRAWPEGTTLTVFWRAETPDQVLVLHWFGTWWRPALLFAFGLFLSWLGLAQYVR
ncbi:MAG: DUF3592 domain-containing protein [Archangiaceae bacterium]|nr:DUF3592 domain-containing protein [Archangiaceae bacterium]